MIGQKVGIFLTRRLLKLDKNLMRQKSILQVPMKLCRNCCHLNIILESAVVKRLIREAYERLEKATHPEPYIAPSMPGGSLFMRNPPPPLEVIFPDGVPPGYSR